MVLHFGCPFGCPFDSHHVDYVLHPTFETFHLLSLFEIQSGASAGFQNMICWSMTWPPLPRLLLGVQRPSLLPARMVVVPVPQSLRVPPKCSEPEFVHRVLVWL